jgi:hypothetical protein
MNQIEVAKLVYDPTTATGIAPKPAPAKSDAAAAKAE